MKDKLTFESILGAAILLFVTVTLFIEILMRYFLNNSLIWTEEIARYLFVWFVYTSMSYAIIANSHIRVDSMIKIIPEKFRLTFTQIGIVIWILFSLVFAFITFTYTLDAFAEQNKAVGSGIPMWLVFLGIPLGFLLTIVRLLKEFIKNFKIMKLSREEE